MSNMIREIYTKALLAKGQKECSLNTNMSLKNKCDSILGCWIVKHTHKAYLNEQDASIKGSFDVHLWYSYHNIQSDVMVCKIEYEEPIPIDKVDQKTLCKTDQPISICVQEPKCKKATIEGDHDVLLEIELVMGVHVVGETMIKIEMKDNDDDLNCINPDFIK